MPEILSMIQVNKMTPAPAVLVVVIIISIRLRELALGPTNEFFLQNVKTLEYFQAFLSLVYLTSSDIFALINYTGFATWVRKNTIF